jgi:cytochrome c556
MEKCVLRLSVVLGLLFGLLAMSGHGEEPKKDKEKVSDLMQKKLKHAQKILEGVAVGDFKKIGDSADELVLISRDAEWKIVNTPRYELFSNQFRDNAEDLIKKAKDKNLDGAALAYLDLTLTCVRCHKYVREERDACRDPARTEEERITLSRK